LAENFSFFRNGINSVGQHQQASSAFIFRNFPFSAGLLGACVNLQVSLNRIMCCVVTDFFPNYCPEPEKVSAIIWRARPWPFAVRWRIQGDQQAEAESTQFSLQNGKRLFILDPKADMFRLKQEMIDFWRDKGYRKPNRDREMFAAERYFRRQNPTTDSSK